LANFSCANTICTLAGVFHAWRQGLCFCVCRSCARRDERGFPANGKQIIWLHSCPIFYLFHSFLVIIFLLFDLLDGVKTCSYIIFGLFFYIRKICKK
jgi:hypothetical protein